MYVCLWTTTVPYKLLEKKIWFPGHNVPIGQHGTLLACGSIIVAQLSHWHSSNLCLQALESAATGWKQGLHAAITHRSFQWITAEGDSSVSQDNLTADMELSIGRAAPVDSQSRFTDSQTFTNLPNSPRVWVRDETNVPVRSQEHCTRMAGRPPSFQRACNVTAGEEQRRTLLWFRLDCWTSKS